MEQRLAASDIERKLRADTTKYDAREVGHAMTENQMMEEQFRICIDNHKHIIMEPEFCVIMQIASDPLIKTLRRRKFYAWPFLPKPRPNQAVFLYNKAVDELVKRLWVLPSDMVMAELSSMLTVDPVYATMKRWSDYFFNGWKADYRVIRNQDPKTWISEPFIKERIWVNTTPSYFFEKIREEHGITLESEHEYMELHREELIKRGCKLPTSDMTNPFDFDKIQVKKVIDTLDTSLVQN